MNRLGLAAIGYTPDDKVPRPDEGEVDGLDKKGFPQTLCVCVCITSTILYVHVYLSSRQTIGVRAIKTTSMAR